VQSTSDQRDFLRYATIAAATPSAVLPEQGAVWAYPQPGQSDEEVSFCMVNAALGRVHLSGLLDEATVAQRERIRAALGVYRRSRGLIAAGLPHWPLGLPGWYDPWVALAIVVADECLVAVWCRDPAGGEVTVPLPWLCGGGWRAEVLFPTDLECQLGWSGGGATSCPKGMTVRVPGGPAARLVRVHR
jgi:alpha-galactosidase